MGNAPESRYPARNRRIQEGAPDQHLDSASPLHSAQNDGVVPPQDYAVTPISTPTTIAKVLGAGLGRMSRAALVKPRAGSVPKVALEYGPRRIDRDGLAAYQQLIGYNVSDSVPAGWIHVMAFPLHLTLFVRPQFPLPPLGMVHLSNTITQLRRVADTEELTFRCWVENLRPHKRGATIEVYSTAHAGDELVWHGVSTYLAKGGKAPQDVAPIEAATREFPEHLPGYHLWKLPKDVGTSYAEVSGDNNPIHTSKLAAKAFGFPRPIVHGMYTAARALAEVPHGEAFTWHVDFFSPVIPPQKVALEFGPEPDGVDTLMRLASTKRTHLVAEVTPAAT